MNTPQDWVVCPDCAQPAEVVRRAALASTAGTVDHVKIQCVQRHWYLMPASRLTAWPSVAEVGAAHRRSGR